MHRMLGPPPGLPRAIHEPVNVRFRALGVGEVPPDFAALRGQWDCRATSPSPTGSGP